MGTSVVRLEREDRIATVILDRPECHNCLDAEMWRSLETAVADLENDLPAVVVVTGAGENAFCAGVDVRPDNPQIQGLSEGARTGTREPVEKVLGEIRRATDRLVALPVPLIAALNGPAYGGGAEMAVRCDLRVMDPRAEICFSEVRLGLMPDCGGGVALTRLTGPGIAADLILTARPVGAAEALRLGLANRVSAAGRCLEEARRMALAIAANGPRAVRSALEVIRRTPDLTCEDALALEFERAVALVGSGECLHGIGAFLSKKRPAFPPLR